MGLVTQTWTMVTSFSPKRILEAGVPPIKLRRKMEKRRRRQLPAAERRYGMSAASELAVNFLARNDTWLATSP